jgi:hypothetical protein
MMELPGKGVHWEIHLKISEELIWPLSTSQEWADDCGYEKG